MNYNWENVTQEKHNKNHKHYTTINASWMKLNQDTPGGMETKEHKVSVPKTFPEI